MLHLTTHEARVLGVLIEKAFTTPNQYPLSLNSISTGASQLSNRDPVIQMDEDHAFDAAEGLRGKQLAVRVDMVGSRVQKYKHMAVETLHCRQAEVAILAELLLRGPQTVGELRGRASRMQPFESLERVTEMLRALMEREDPLVKELAPVPGSRAMRYAQLLCPEAHSEAHSDTHSEKLTETGVVESVPVGRAETPMRDDLEDRVAKLEAEVAVLRIAVKSMADGLGIVVPEIPSAV